MKKVDVHCHADMYSDAELAAIFKNTEYWVVGAATSFDSGRRLLELAQKHNRLKVCLGIHPEYPQAFSDFDEVAAQIKNNLDKIVAVGEVGLPWYCLEKMDEEQKAAINREATQLLSQFIQLAKETGLPIILHAIEDTASQALDALEKQEIEKALFHWFEGNEKDLARIVKANYFISISPDAMFNQRYGEFTDLIPLANLTLESDGPWKYNSEKGIPSMIEDTARFLADRRNISAEVILQTNTKNCLDLFGKNQFV